MLACYFVISIILIYIHRFFINVKTTMVSTPAGMSEQLRAM